MALGVELAKMLPSREKSVSELPVGLSESLQRQLLREEDRKTLLSLAATCRMQMLDVRFRDSLP